MSLTHAFASAFADGPDTTKLQPSDWNADHVISGGNLGALVFQDTAGAPGLLNSVAVGSVLVSGGVGVAPAWSATPTLAIGVSGSARFLQATLSDHGAVGHYNFTVGYAANTGDVDRGDHAMSIGYNTANGAGRENANEPAFEWRIEDYFKPAGTAYVEAHWQYFDATGASYRPIAIQIDRANGGYLTDSPMALKGSSLSYLGANNTQYAKFSHAALQLMNSTVLTNEVNNITWLRQLNAAGNNYVSLAWVNSSDITIVGGDNGIQTIGATSAAFFQTANFTGGANNDNAGSVLRVGPNGVSQAAKLYGGRWSSTNRGARLVGVSSGGGETTYVQVNGDGSQIELIAGDIKWGKALVALGGGAAPTLGTIGGSGPATAAQNSWMRVLDSAGVAFWVPVWK